MAEAHQPAGGVWTYEEYAKLPDVEGVRYEIIGGELYVSRTPPVQHAEVLGSFLCRMFGWVRQHGVGTFLPGPINVLFADGDFVLPDFVFVRRDRLRILTRRAFEGVPDLIIECVAPDTAERDRTLKRERYARFGVPEYWIVDAEARTVEIHRNGSGGSHVPEVVRDRWSWQPVPDGPMLELSLPELLVEYDELQAQFARDERRHVVLTSTNERG